MKMYITTTTTLIFATVVIFVAQESVASNLLNILFMFQLKWFIHFVIIKIFIDISYLDISFLRVKNCFCKKIFCVNVTKVLFLISKN